jgi:predicted nucleic acid-binding protein
MKYLDTSAFVKNYRNEEKGSTVIHELLNDSREGKEQLMTSFLALGETISVFDKWARRNYISSKECSELIKTFLKELKELFDNGILALEPVSTSTILECLELITKHHISMNDAMHLYTALANKPAVSLFVCSDNNLIKAAKAEGIEVLNPEEV